MAIRTTAELLETLSGLVPSDDDNSLAIIEDFTDTLNSFAEAEDWRTRYEENDRAWREKYRARFFDGSPDDGTKPDEVIEDEIKEKTKFEELFTEE